MSIHEPTEATAHQKKILKFIAERVAQQLPVRLADLCIHFGWQSTNTAWSHVKQLRAKGLLRRGDVVVKTQGLVLTQAGREEAQ
jgi:hypothetical protein